MLPSVTSLSRCTYVGPAPHTYTQLHGKHLLEVPQILALATDDQTHHREGHLNGLSDRLRNVVLVEDGSNSRNDRIGRRRLCNSLLMRPSERTDSILLRVNTSFTRLSASRSVSSLPAEISTCCGSSISVTITCCGERIMRLRDCLQR